MIILTRLSFPLLTLVLVTILSWLQESYHLTWILTVTTLVTQNRTRLVVHPDEFSDHMDSETLSDLEDNQESVAGEVYRTRSGRPCKPPDRYTPSKALLVADFWKRLGGWTLYISIGRFVCY